MRVIEISTDPLRLDLPRIHGWLSRQSTWARGIPYDRVRQSVAHSPCFGAYVCAASGEAASDLQVGFARVISDRATFAYLCDVFVEPGWRGRGIARRLMDAIGAHPALQDLRRFALVTSRAHGLYARYGFIAVAGSSNWMERHRPDVYAGMEQ